MREAILHQRRPAAFPLVRTALLVASGLALVGYLAFPTAPPRLAGIGVVDTVSHAHVDLNTGLVSSLYNPYAAVPSMHIGYALIVAGSVFWYSRRALVRALAPLYPPFVLLVVVATGNHFILDAAAGALVAGLAVAAAALLTTSGFRRSARGSPWSRPGTSWRRWTPNWGNDLPSHFTLSSVTLPVVRPTSGPGCGHRSWCTSRGSC